MRKLFTIIFLAILCFNAMAYDFSAVCGTGQTLYYNITSDVEPYTVEVTSETGRGYNTQLSGDLEIPESVEYNGMIYSVSSIGDYAFNDCIGLTSITIPYSIISIGRYAFAGCRQLTSVYYTGNIDQWCEITFDNQPLSYAHNLYVNNILVTDLVISEAINEIKANAFSGASCLTSVTIGNSVISIGDEAFSGCSGLTGELTIPNSVTNIGFGAFSSCNGLTSVVISNSVTSIGNSVFQNCSGITTPIYNDNIFVYFPCSYATEYTIPDEIQQIAGGAFYNCTDLTSVTIPNSVIDIAGNAFYGCSGITSITIPNSVTSIGQSVFSGCINLSSITIGDSVSSIEEWAFSNCSSLTDFTIGKSITSIGGGAFSGCSGLTTVNFNATNCILMGSLNVTIFDGCTSLATLNIGENVTNIPDNAFLNCSSLNGVLAIPDSVTNIGSNAFEGCSGLSSVTIGKSVSNIGFSAFSNCNGLESIEVNIDNSIFDSRDNSNAIIETATNTLILGCKNTIISSTVTSIGGAAFYGCSSLSSVTIPDSITIIGEAAFFDCSGLTGDLTIPNYVTSIGDYAFSGCSGITELTIGNSVESIGYGSFYNCSELTIVNFNATDCIEMGNGATPAFKDCSSLSTLNIGNNVTNIPEFAFYGCNELREVAIPNSVTNIGLEAFAETGWYNDQFDGILYLDGWCLGYKGEAPTETLSISEDTKGIGGGSFAGLTDLTEVTIPNSVKGIGSLAFNSCGIITVNFNAENCTYIGSDVWVGCFSLTTLNIGEHVTSISYGAFEHCSELTTVNFNATNCTMMDIPFPDCEALSILNIGENVTNIPEYAFYGCNGISNINTNSTIPPILNTEAFSTEVKNTATVWTKCESANDYRNDSEWGQFTNIQGDTTVNYTITVLSQNETMGSVIGAGTFTCEDDAIITATPNEGYQFVQWSDGNTDNPRTVIVTADSTFTAGFRAAYTVTVQANNDAYGSVSGGGTYEEGSTVTLTAMPYEGYNFVSWNDGDESSPRTIVVTSDSTFIADFVKCEITYAIDTVVNNFVTVGDHTFYSTGNYTFAVSHETACDTIYDIRLRVLAEPIYDIGPNPTKSLLNINSDGFISAVEFYSVTGQLVMRKEVNGYEAEFDMEGLVDGVYILRIYGEESSLPSVYKVVKE